MPLRLVSLRVVAAVLLLTGWGAGEVQAQPAFLVKDINTSQVTSYSSLHSNHESEEAGGIFYFSFFAGTQGSEIWRSDGTSGGTHLLKDICPGACSSDPRALTASGSLLFFTADDQINGRRLWKSDGTPQGTTIVADVLPGVDSTRDSLLDGGNGTLYFSAYNPTDGAEIWATDGTAEGTHRVADIPLAGSLGPRLLAAEDGLVLFAARNGGDWETWITDGTEAGTRMLVDVNPGFDTFPPFFASGRDAIAAPWGGFIFVAQDGKTWITDGTQEGTSPLIDAAVEGSPSPYGFTVLNGLVLFGGTDSLHGGALWRTDGTPAGTFPLTEGNSVGLTAVGNQVFFRGGDSENGAELWITDGTPAGTRMVRDILPGPAGALSNLVHGFSRLGDHLVFFATQDFSTYDLWESDGTFAGTRPIMPPPGGWPSPSLNSEEGFGVAGGRFFYLGDSGLVTADRTATGSVEIETLPPLTSAFEIHFGDRFPGSDSFGALNGTLLFGVLDGPDHELWRSDGTAAGTWRVTDLPPSSFAPPDYFLEVNDHLVFRAGADFSATDGTPQGTLLLPPTQAINPVRLGDQAFLIAFDFPHPGLWRTDGTPAGTVVVAELRYDEVVYPPQLTVWGGKLFFRTQNPWDIWVSDGTQAGSGPLVTAGLGPAGLTDGGSALFFHSHTPETGYELWKTDGTLAGTVLVKDIQPGSEGAMDSDFAYFQLYAPLPGGGVVFAADDGESGLELWKSDGTEAGTVRLLDILPGLAGSEPHYLTRAGNKVFFVANNGVHGYELWVTDGTSLGTHMVKDIQPGPGSSVPGDFKAIGSVLVFSAFDDAHGLEVWRSDGTILGTRRLQDIAPGPASSSPQQFTPSGDKIFFAANDNVTGFELWAMPKTALSTFADVPTDYWAWRFIEALALAGFTSGCGNGSYCPSSAVTRAEMAVFLERGIHGPAFVPPPATGTRFTDVPADYWAAPWIEQLAAEGVTAGCGGGNYCPGAVVTRAEMAVFLLLAKHGPDYTPPPATGTRFTDVPAGYWAAAWIEQLAAEGVTAGCTASSFCTEAPVTRGQIAVFLTTTFGLPLP